MSRDFTPRDLYMADRFLAQKGPPLRKTEITLTYDGKDMGTINKAQLELQKKFPNLGFLFERLPDVYRPEKFSVEETDALLAEIEEMLTALIERDCETGKAPEHETLEPMWKWFHGELDTNFYYHETNDALFLEWLLDRQLSQYPDCS